MHPKTGALINGHDHPTARNHHELILDLEKKDKAHKYRDYAEWGHTKHGDNFIRNVHHDNAHAVLKGSKQMPHSDSTHVDDAHFDHPAKVHHHIKSMIKPKY